MLPPFVSTCWLSLLLSVSTCWLSLLPSYVSAGVEVYKVLKCISELPSLFHQFGLLVALASAWSLTPSINTSCIDESLIDVQQKFSLLPSIQAEGHSTPPFYFHFAVTVGHCSCQHSEKDWCCIKPWTWTTYNSWTLTWPANACWRWNDSVKGNDSCVCEWFMHLLCLHY
jgi:hypothetical protein